MRPSDASWSFCAALSKAIPLSSRRASICLIRVSNVTECVRTASVRHDAVPFPSSLGLTLIYHSCNSRLCVNVYVPGFHVGTVTSYGRVALSICQCRDSARVPVKMLYPMKKAFKKILQATRLRRRHVAAGRMYCERHLLATTIGARPMRARSTGRILCYHSIGQAASGVNDVKPKQFRRQIELAFRSGFRFVPPAQIARTGGSPMDLAITFDDAWTSVLSEAAPILRDHDIPWLLFVVKNWSDHGSDWAKEFILPWRDIERLMAFGAKIGSHSVSHPDFGSIERTQMIDELCGSRDTILQRLGFAPTDFAIPYGQSMNWAAAASEIAHEAGYQTVYAQAEETRPSGTVPRTFVTCFDSDRIFNALLRGAYDRWEEWV